MRVDLQPQAQRVGGDRAHPRDGRRGLVSTLRDHLPAAGGDAARRWRLRRGAAAAAGEEQDRDAEAGGARKRRHVRGF